MKNIQLKFDTKISITIKSKIAIGLIILDKEKSLIINMLSYKNLIIWMV